MQENELKTFVKENSSLIYEYINRKILKDIGVMSPDFFIRLVDEYFTKEEKIVSMDNLTVDTFGYYLITEILGEAKQAFPFFRRDTITLDKIFKDAKVYFNHVKFAIEDDVFTIFLVQTKGKAYIAEAKALRAMLYYGLLQFFAKPYADGNGSKPGLPLRLTGIKGSGSSELARSTVGEVYTQILKDLNEAEADLPLTNGSATLNTTRVHKNTVIAFKTRVYLSMQKYPEAVNEANKIVSSTAPFTATTGVAHRLEANLSTVFTSYTTNESIFSLPMTNTAGDFPGTQNQITFQKIA
jgi:hypothetical protein